MPRFTALHLRRPETVPFLLGAAEKGNCRGEGVKLSVTTLNGVIPVLVSPMHEDGSPDKGGYERLLEHLFENPLAGLWVLGSGSENFTMPYDDRVAVARIVAEHMSGRTQIILGCSDPVLSEVYRYFDDTAHLPIQGYHCLPTDRKMGASMAVDYWSAVADRSPLPMWLYSNPARALDPAVEAVNELSKHPNIAGMKIGGYDLTQMTAIAMLNSDSFQVLGAGGGNHLAYLALGVKGCTMSTASSFPRQHCEVHALWEQGRIDEARDKAFALIRIIKQFPARRNTETSAEEKAVLELLGICKRWVRAPFKPLSDDTMGQLRSVLERNGIL